MRRLAAVALGLVLGVGAADAAPFRDISGYWGEDYISTLATRKFIDGFPDGTFRPEAPITRAQFAAMAARAFDLPDGAGQTTFKDIRQGYWAAPAIATVVAGGLATGFPDGTYRPGENITRAQVFVILSRVLGRYSESPTAALDRYVDAQAVPEWAREATLKAADAGIIVSYPNPEVLKPNALATRGEVAAMLYQTLGRVGFSLPPLAVGVAGADPRSADLPRVSPPPQRLAIDRIVVTPDYLAYRTGDEVSVRVFATPGAEASFGIGGIAQSLPLAEVKPGLYEGRYTVKRGDQEQNARLTVILRTPDGQTVTEEAGRRFNFG